MTTCEDLLLADEAATLALGARLAMRLPAGCVQLLGELGAGKTCLVRGWLHALGHTGAVKSPTYTLVEPYQLQGRQIYHFDLYRLEDPEELELIGGRDYFDAAALCLVEWPEKGRGYLPAPQLIIRLSVEGAARRARLEWQTQETQA